MEELLTVGSAETVYGCPYCNTTIKVERHFITGKVVKTEDYAFTYKQVKKHMEEK